MTTKLATRVALVAILFFGVLVGVGPTPQASAAPNLVVALTGPELVLVGGASAYTVTATNATGTPGYNTGFRVVVPAGVTLATSSVPATTFTDAPGIGQTTFIWENINDSQPGSDVSLNFSLNASPTTWPVGSTIDVTAEAYTSDDPRVVPTSDTGGVMGSSTGSGSDTDSVLVTAVTIDKSEPSTEEELLRGIHDHATTYSLVVENNTNAATNSVIVDDYLPAGLEYLGCGTVDNTTDAPTFPGNNVEYSGAPRLDVSTTDIVADCPTPTLVETVSVDPDGGGPLPLAVYTHIQWSLGNLTTGEVRTVTYAAGIPIRENTTTWSGATPATTGAQTANLDNNGGAETSDEQVLRNLAEVSGTYTGTLGSGATNPVGDSDTAVTTAEDIRVRKSVSPVTVTQTTATIWTITIETSEYRTANNVDVTDTLPDGHCPLGASNFDSSDPGGECAPTGDNPTTVYTTVTENADGSWTLFWDDLATMTASDSVVLTFPSKVRVSYQENGSDDTPVVTADGFTNTVSVSADDFIVAGIDGDEVDGLPDLDTSSASQTASVATIDKTISVPAAAGVTLDCSTATYVDAATMGDAEFAYRLGDRVCYTLRLNIPADLTLHEATITDFLPSGTTYHSDLGPTGNNDVVDVNGPLNFDDGTAIEVNDSNISWEIGTADIGGERYLGVSNADRVWEVRFMAEITAVPVIVSDLDAANLMKMTTQNTAGTPTRSGINHCSQRSLRSLASQRPKMMRTIWSPVETPSDTR